MVKSFNETRILKAQRIKVCKSNYPRAKGYWKLSQERNDVGLFYQTLTEGIFVLILLKINDKVNL